VGNRPQQPADNRAAPQCDSEINNPRKLSKRRKYEGKWLVAWWSVRLPRRLRTVAINRFLGEFTLLFILAAGSFSNMFTTYSHMRCGRRRQLA